MSGRYLIMHVDGSHVVAPRSKEQSFGWGLVALHDDAHHEVWGHHRAPKVSPLLGYHEHLAFVNGVLYARAGGFDFRDVSIYCDCNIFGYAQTSLHPGNYNQERAEKLMQRLHTVAKHAFDPSVVDLVLDAFRHSRLVKLKGHSFQVYQERADYLARHAARQGMLAEHEQCHPKDMDAWLAGGIAHYAPAKDAQPGSPPRYVEKLWRAPFVDVVPA